MVVIQWQTTGSIARSATTLILVNLAITFAIPGISWGGHIGGLVGGVLALPALTHFGTRHVAYARITPVAVVSLIAIRSAACSSPTCASAASPSRRGVLAFARGAERRRASLWPPRTPRLAQLLQPTSPGGAVASSTAVKGHA